MRAGQTAALVPDHRHFIGVMICNGGKLEIAQQMANHESARTIGVCHRKNDQVSLAASKTGQRSIH